MKEVIKINKFWKEFLIDVLLTGEDMKIEGVWGVMLCRLLDIYRRFGGTYVHLHDQAGHEIPSFLNLLNPEDGSKRRLPNVRK
jgi:hypothetical protein